MSGTNDQETIRIHNRAIKHHEFCRIMYREKVKQGRHCVHEQPVADSSWNLYCASEVAKMQEVVAVNAYLCQFGLKTGRQRQTEHVMTHTRFMTNSPWVAVELSRVRKREQEHTRLLDRKFGPAAMYTE